MGIACVGCLMLRFLEGPEVLERRGKESEGHMGGGIRDSLSTARWWKTKRFCCLILFEKISSNAPNLWF